MYLAEEIMKRDPERILQNGDSDSSSRLETLPAELRRQLLISMPNLPTLLSLVRASSMLHAQYLHDRDTILRTCLDRELHGPFVDAVGTLISRVHMLGSPRTNERIEGFLEQYRGWLVGSTPHPHINSLDAGSVRWPAAYHLSVAIPLARRYSRWALAKFSETTSLPIS